MTPTATRATATLSTLVLWAALLSGVATASVPDEGRGGSAPPVAVTAELLDVEDDRLARSLWAWPEGLRVYRLAGSARTASFDGFPELVAYDSDQLTEVGRLELQPGAYAGQEVNSWYGRNLSNAMAVDHERGRLFIAYQAQLGTVDAGSRPCTLDPNHSPCLAGFHVVDGRSLASLGKMEFTNLTADAAIMEPMLRASSYAPPRAEGDNGKLLVLVEELQHNRYEGTGLTSGTENTIPRRNGAALYYAVQMNPETGRADWTVRVEGCRSSREQRDGSWMHRPNPATIFRSSDFEDPSIWVGCHSGNSAGTVVRIPLDAQGRPPLAPVQVAAPEAPTGAPSAQLAAPVRQAAAQATFVGPDRTLEMVSDPVSERILMRVDDNAETWWVFDGKTHGFAGAIGIGGYIPGDTANGFDPVAGRLYVLGGEKAAGVRAATRGGLFVADIRGTPLAQARQFEEFAGLAYRSATWSAMSMVAMRRDGGDHARVLVAADPSGNAYRVLEDRVPVPVPTESDDFAGRSQDLDEAPGVTNAAFDGAARGYGARLLMVGGAEAASRIGPMDPVGITRGAYDGAYTPWVPREDVKSLARAVHDNVLPSQGACPDAAREVVFGSVGPDGPVVVDANGSRAAVQPVILGQTTQADLEAPASRCSGQDWERLWTTALFGSPPVEEPKGGEYSAMFAKQTADCLSSDEDGEQSAGDPVAQRMAGSVDCQGEGASGWSQVRGLDIPGLSLGAMMTSFRVYRDPGRGMVSRVEAAVRGISIDSVVKIATVRTTAESWANGRKQPVDSAERAVDYVSNCDYQRTAGTCFRRHIGGVWTPSYECGPCGDEQALISAVGRALGGNATVRMREPDHRLALGSENGFIAAIQKRDSERFADLALNNDLLQTIVPGLEIIRYAPQGRPSVAIGPQAYIFGMGPRGRQIIQLAGVEVSTSYAISCVLVYDEMANTCAEAVEPPGSITVSLVDVDGQPLAGGAFEVHSDVDADGVLGLTDALVADGACVTAQDGVGTCTFTGLEPGTYLVSQTAAPAGYAMTTQPWVSQVSAGELRTVVFTNVSDVSSIELTVTDQAGAPVAGAVFAAYPDPDGDGKIAPDAQPAGQCTTDADGVCSMQVAAGSYVLVQTSAPDGLEAIEPVAFTFASGGQVAAVGVVNHPPDTSQPPSASAAPVYSPPVDVASPVEMIGRSGTPAGSEPPPQLAPDDGIVGDVGGTVVRVIRAPGDALRLLARDPKQAVAWTAALALFAIAALAVRRRQAAVALIESAGDFDVSA